MAGDAAASGDSATLRGRHAIEVLTQTGQRLGYTVETEFPVQGGRIDVVWLTDLPAAFDTDSLVIAAFEVESSWRTRKHLKGDYLNLFDVGAAVGVLVLLGQGADVDSTAVSRNCWCSDQVRESWSGVTRTSTGSRQRSTARTE
jgi:hypothetical protein